MKTPVEDKTGNAPEPEKDNVAEAGSVLIKKMGVDENGTIQMETEWEPDSVRKKNIEARETTPDTDLGGLLDDLDADKNPDRDV